MWLGTNSIIDSSQMIVFFVRKSAETTTKSEINKIIRINDLVSINLHFHETLFCVFASQAEMQFDFVGGKNVISGQHLLLEAT
jgi:hypothetical protein